MKLNTKAIMELVEGDLTASKLHDLLPAMPDILKNIKIIRPLIKRLVLAWSQSDEKASLLAYSCLLAIVRNGDHVRNVVQNMYSAFVKNCKFVNTENIIHIRLMEGTLTSVLEQDLNESFHFAYMHVQNMAAHLRKALSQPRGENLASVYNWQYIRSLSLWCRFLSKHTDHKQLSTLVYPLVQNIEGTLRLCPSARWIPLRFHCLEMLNCLSAAANLLIPVIPFIIDVFDIVDFNKRHINSGAESNKPLNLAVMLRFSNSQMRDRTFRDAVMDSLYELLIENIHAHSKSICFPEYVRALVHELREFCRTCKVANYCKPIRVLLQKINENILYVEHNRRSISDLNDKKAVEILETVMRPPLSTFYEAYRQRRDAELRQIDSGKALGEEEEEEEEEDDEDEDDAFEMDEEGSDAEKPTRKMVVKDDDMCKLAEDDLDVDDEDLEDLDDDDLDVDENDDLIAVIPESDDERKVKSNQNFGSASKKKGSSWERKRPKKRAQVPTVIVSDESSDVDMEAYLQSTSLAAVHDSKSGGKGWRAKGPGRSNGTEASEEDESSGRQLKKNLNKYFETKVPLTPKSDARAMGKSRDRKRIGGRSGDQSTAKRGRHKL